MSFEALWMKSFLMLAILPCNFVIRAFAFFQLFEDFFLRAKRSGKAPCTGTPVRREVEALVRKKHGNNYLEDRQSKTELAGINRELKRLKAPIARLEERKC
jgi:hypothetical protein